MPSFDERALFIFDQCKYNKEWLHALNTLHLEYKEKDKRIGGVAFEDDKHASHIALQAADLLAYVVRLHVKSIRSGTESRSSTVLSFILYRNTNIKLRCMGNEEWEHLIGCIRDPNGYAVVLASPDGSAGGKWKP